MSNKKYDQETEKSVQPSPTRCRDQGRTKKIVLQARKKIVLQEWWGPLRVLLGDEMPGSGHEVSFVFTFASKPLLPLVEPLNSSTGSRGGSAKMAGFLVLLALLTCCKVRSR